MEYLWLILAVVFLIAEAVSFQLVSIWFAVGAVAALITQLAGGDLSMQCILFVAVTTVCLIVTRPLIRKIKKKTISTNFDRILGQQAVVLEEINQLENTGQVKIAGQVWSVRSADESVIPKDAWVKVEKIEGVKLIVTKIK